MSTRLTYHYDTVVIDDAGNVWGKHMSRQVVKIGTVGIRRLQKSSLSSVGIVHRITILIINVSKFLTISSFCC